MFNHILVPLDGSLLAERAIAHAEQFARVFGGKISLLQVLDPSRYHDSSSEIEPLNWQIRKAEAEMYLQGTAAKIRANGIVADHALREGRTPENIVDFAHAENVDLVVMSTHGASGLSRWNTSSVVSKVLEKIYLPVLLTRAYHDAGGSTLVSSETGVMGQSSGQQAASEAGERVTSIGSTTISQPDSPSFLYRRILLPIDSSLRAECALPAVTTLVKAQPGEQVTVIMGAVISAPVFPLPAPYPEEIHQLIDRFQQISRSAMEHYLAELTQRLQTNSEVRIVENDNISAALHELVDQENIDLVVLCAHGRTGGTNYPYGSVARNYLEHGTRPVLVVQDVPVSQVRPTAAEIAAEKYGRR